MFKSKSKQAMILALLECLIHVQLHFACKLWRGISKESGKINVALIELDNMKEKVFDYSRYSPQLILL